MAVCLNIHYQPLKAHNINHFPAMYLIDLFNQFHKITHICLFSDQLFANFAQTHILFSITVIWLAGETDIKRILSTFRLKWLNKKLLITDVLTKILAEIPTYIRLIY